MARTDSDHDEKEDVGASSQYALFQFSRALVRSETHDDPDVRARARRKAEAWQRVFSGMLRGALSVGSRTPVADTPAWATLEVLTGGFASGQLLAGGPLRPHEQAILERTKLVAAAAERPGAERAVLNAYYLGEAGLAELDALLGSGCYRIEVPEEGALLVVAWLLRNGHVDRAQEILTSIGPFLSRLRFYPLPHPHPFTPSSVVHVEAVGETVKALSAIEERAEVQPQREALRIWNPFLDRLVNLFIETVDGDLPAVRLDDHGRPLRNTDGSWTLSGGWPCQRYTDDWRERARTLLADYKRLRAKHHRTKKPERKKENLAQLLGYLERCVSDPRALSGRDVGMIRLILAHIIAARGLPDSPRCRVLRVEQARQATLPTKKELAAVMMGRLVQLPQDGGIDDLESLLTPITEDESQRLTLPVSRPIPKPLRQRLLRAQSAPMKQLVDDGVIKSSEMLARVLPQLVAQVGAAGIADFDLRRLYIAIYQAFRRRRSLLLLNLERQVRLDELPWVSALHAFREGGANQRENARLTLVELFTLAVTAFPQAILPNKLLQEIRQLVDRAGLHVPIVDEIAADIFMGQFTEKYVKAAQLAAKLLKGTLYETYYGISYDAVLRIRDLEPAYQGGPPISRVFFRMCSELAGQSPKDGRRSVAANGCLLEQEQILTTHNLAPLIDALALRETLQPQLGDLCRRIFLWICKQQQHQRRRHPGDWRARLHMIKNTAYAFRQMVFFLSLDTQPAVEEFISWAIARLGEQHADFQARFQPALAGLLRAACNEYPNAPPESRRFLGWTDGSHWLNVSNKDA